MDKSKIESLNPQEYTHLPHAEQHFEGHEQTDVAIRPLVWTLVSIGLIIVVSLIGMWGLFKVLKLMADKETENQQFSAVEAPPREVPQGYPPLQGIPARSAHQLMPAGDMKVMKQENLEILAGKRPMRAGLPPGKPIDQAMDEALSKKIFKTGGAAPQQQKPAQAKGN
jgi:hypothetical protein